MAQQPPSTPRIRFSLLWKITIPFMLLAMLLGLGTTYFVNRMLTEEETERFLRILVDSGQQATDSIVRAESYLLDIERLVANTDGIAEAVTASDAEELRARVLPIVISAAVDTVVVLDSEGVSLLAVRRQPDAAPGTYDTPLRGEAFYQDWEFVQKVLAGEVDEAVGDKQAGMEVIQIGDESIPVFFIAGPILNARGTLVGVSLAGMYVDSLVQQVSQESGANATIYEGSTGRLLGTTLEPEGPDTLTLSAESIEATWAEVEGQSPVRPSSVAGSEYWEVLTPLVARQGSAQLGILGISLRRVIVESNAQESVLMVVGVGAGAILFVVILGFLISNSITRPLVDIVEASTQVAMGNLDTFVQESGGDELGVLSRTFNRMVEGLQEGSIYRDLLGRTVTPEVRDQLRKTLADQESPLRGQRARATILFADLRGYTSLAETFDPAKVMDTLNDYFSGVVPIIMAHQGVVNQFDGDSVMAFFGILPQSLPPQISALQATHAAVEILEHIETLNTRRQIEGAPAFELGIGVATGEVIAGALGSEDRLHYTVVGDPVNIAQRIQQIVRDLGGSGVVISQDTYGFLRSARNQFVFGRKGVAQIRGKVNEVSVYEVKQRKDRLVDEGVVVETMNLYTQSWRPGPDELDLPTDQAPTEPIPDED
jgi:adenylate cyclase